MDKLIRKIIEIDKKAQEIADEANSASSGLSSETEAEIEKIRSEYDEKLKAELDRREAEIKAETEKKLSGAKTRHSAEMAQLEESYSGSDKLKKQIFNDILEVM